MAVGQREERQPARWLHVKRGDLIDKKNGESLGWASGVITGIRMTQSDRFGHLELHVRLHDPALDETVIIAGTLATVDPSTKDLNDFTIWARMLVGRLICQRNKLSPEEAVRIEFYPIETSYGDAACVALYRDGSDVRLEGRKISTDDREVMAKGLFWLAEQYPWGAGSTALPVEEEVKKLGSGDGAGRPSESVDDVAGAIESTAQDAELDDDPRGAIDADPVRSPGPGGITERLYGTPSTRAQVERTATTPSEEDDDLPF